MRAAARIRGLAPVTVAALQDRRGGEEVLVEGRISSRNPVRSASTEFVAYVTEWREITYDDEGRAEAGNWTLSGGLTPPLLLELPDGLLQIGNDDYDIEDGLVVEEREPGQSLDEVSTRYRGIRRGDAVIAVGGVTAGGEPPQITADFVARGTRLSYVARRRLAGLIFCGFSIVVAALGGTVPFWDRVSGLLSPRRSTMQPNRTGRRSVQDGEGDR
jgi:hypothetical protein